MKKLSFSFECEASDVDEPAYSENEHSTPHEYAMSLAMKKARAVLLKRQNEAESQHIVLGMDTIVVVSEKVLGKPKTRKEAYDMIDALQGTWHKVITAYALVSPSREKIGFEETLVHFLPLSSREIDHFLDREQWNDKAGGYGIQSEGALIIDQIRGCFYNVVGFPLSQIHRLLLESFNQQHCK